MVAVWAGVSSALGMESSALLACTPETIFFDSLAASEGVFPCADSAQAKELGAYADYLDGLSPEQRKKEVNDRGIEATRVGIFCSTSCGRESSCLFFNIETPDWVALGTSTG